MQDHSFEIVRPYVLNHLKRNYWKVESYMDWEDALSEAKLQFIRTVQRLQKRSCVIENEKHLMSLFKTSWNNHFITLANKATKERFVQSQNDDGTDSTLTNYIGDLDNNGQLTQLMQQAPDEVKQVIRLLLSAPDELAYLLQKEFNTNKEMCNKHLCLLLNKNGSTNLIQTMLDYLGID